MNIINLLVFITFIISFYLLIHYRLVKNTNINTNTRAIVKSSSNPNEYFPVIVGDTNSNQKLLTDPLDLNYNAQTGTLYAKNISANFNGSAASALNLAKNGTGNLLLQTNATTTSLFPQGNRGQVLTSQANNSPIWSNPSILSGTFSFPNAAFFGTGSSGNNTITGSVGGGDNNLFYNNLTIDSNGIFALSGNKLFVLGTLIIRGAIINNGQNANGSIGGLSGKSYPGDNRNIAGTTAISSYIGSKPPRPPTITAFTNTYNLFNGGNGGSSSGNFGGDAGFVRVLGNIQEYLSSPMITELTNYRRNIIIDGGSAGGCGESVRVNNVDQLGGGGGGGGGVVHICANKIQFEGGGRIEARGGNGGSVTTNAYGGGGGGGGLIFIVTREITGSPTYNVTGGIGGSSGSNRPGGINGNPGRVVTITL